MGQRGKSRVWPYLVALNEALSKPLTAVSAGLVKLEETWEEIDHGKDTQEIKAEVQAIRVALSETPDDTLSGEIGELAALTGLTSSELRSIVTRRARGLGVISDAERLSEYKKHLVARYEYADFAGITQMTTVVSVRLDDLFVPLAAVPESEVRAASEEERTLREEMERSTDPEERARIEARLGERGPRGFRRAAEDRATPVPEVLRREGKVVLLGDPGSGKTTLMKWLARQCAKGTEASAEALGCTRDWLPVVVPIARYGAAVEEDAGLHLHEHIRRELNRDEGDGFGELVLERAEQGGCVFLLDGLDEIPDPKWRLAAARGVSELLGRFGRSSFLITSRIVGYSVCRVTGGAAHYMLEGFGDEDIKRFARQWAEAYERASHPEAVDLDRAKREAAELAEAIFDQEHPQIVEFARNPLLLTILALIKQRRVELPHRRVQLYETALETLMESWVKARSMGGPVRGMDLDTGESVRVWRRIAYWMHKEKPTGTAHRTELMRELERALYEEKGLEGEEAERTAADYLRTASERAGLLLARGENMFGFLHQTFEEYLAAMHLASPPHRAFEKLRLHLHDPRWREVVLLTAGYIGDVQRQPELAGELVDSIRQAGSRYEDILHRDLLLAAECLAERTPVDRKCEQSVISDLCRLLQQGNLIQEEENDIVDLIAQMGHVRPSPTNTLGLIKLLSQESGWVRSSAVLTLRNASDEQAEVALTAALGDEDDTVAGCAAAVLVQRGRSGQDVLSTLARGLAAGFFSNFMARSVRSLSGVVVPGLITLLGSESGELRGKAVDAVATLDASDPSVICALLACLRSEDQAVRARAAQGLGSMRATHPSVVPALLLRLKDDDCEVRANAAGALGELEATDSAVVPALLSLAADQDCGVRAQVARALRKLGAGNPETVPALLRLLTDWDSDVRASSAMALGELRIAGTSAVSSLLACLMDEDWEVRTVAGSALGQLESNDPSIAASVLRLLDDANPGARAGAAMALGELRPSTATVSSLVACLEDGDAGMRSTAAEALGRLRASDPAALAALVLRLKDPSPAVRRDASWALGEIGVADPSILAALVRRLQDGDRGPRATAAWALEKLAPLPESLLGILRQILAGEDREMRYMTARLLALSEEGGE